MMCELIGGPHDGLLIELKDQENVERIITGDAVEYIREGSVFLDVQIDPYSLIPVKFVFGKESG